MLATLVKEPFDDPDWVFETKWDGFRALAHKGKKVELLSRNNLSFNEKFPEIVKELQAMKGNFVLDGEIVILDKKKRSSFQLLQNNQENKNAYYYVFDILFYDGDDLRKLTLLERKKILKQLLVSFPNPHIRFSDHKAKNGRKLFAVAKAKNWEGIIAKRKSSLYVSKRSKDWLKIKCKLRQEVVIGGFTQPRHSREYFGALLIGVYEKGKFVYVGHVGGGFNRALLQSVYAELKKYISKVCPFTTQPRANMPVTWIKPKLVCEVEFSEWTEAGSMRHPIFVGMRFDKSPKGVVREI